jgi:hypothetical protein
MTDVFKLIEANGLTLHGDIEHFAALVAAAEREACAKVCDDFEVDAHDNNDLIYRECATAIRARGQA